MALAALLAALLVVTLSACGQAQPSQSLPDFPAYKPADDFMAMQARMQRHQPPPQEPAYTPRNQQIHEAIQNQVRASQGELEYRARMQAEAVHRNRAANQQGWDSLQARLERDLTLDSARDAELNANAGRNRVKYQARYDMYRERLERVAQDAEQRAQERDLNAYRNQQRIAERLEDLRTKQAATIRLFSESLPQSPPPPPPGGSPTGRVPIPGTQGAVATPQGQTAAPAP